MIKKIYAILIASLLFTGCAHFKSPAIDAGQHVSLETQLSALEAKQHGRIGLFVINANGASFGYHENERFPFCSTGKWMVVAATLKYSMTHPGFLNEKVHYSRQTVARAGYAPVTKRHLKQGMTVAELAAAAIQYSDSAAMNILVKKLGGPAAINAFARSIGDTDFHLDRYEPKLNTAIPKDLRDTTTPRAMANSLRSVMLGNVLGASERALLQAWLKGNTTGDKRIRAGVPVGWQVADKTGTGDYGTTNDVAVLWPPNGEPIVMVIYFTQHSKKAEPRDELIANVTKIVIAQLAETD